MWRDRLGEDALNAVRELARSSEALARGGRDGCWSVARPAAVAHFTRAFLPRNNPPLCIVILSGGHFHRQRIAQHGVFRSPLLSGVVLGDDGRRDSENAERFSLAAPARASGCCKTVTAATVD